ncbi:MAG: hypothetical protein UH654_11485 [Lachnospiraceae bacterium]|nr:hypothetical protein [Lachnospiraceae bacterium]MEE0960631.1 hypothetical protein [Lachnospiraceae bacterium]
MQRRHRKYIFLKTVIITNPDSKEKEYETYESAFRKDTDSRYERLIIALTDDGRPEDIVHMAVNAGLREKLYIQYDIR